MKRTTVPLILILTVVAMLATGLLSYLLYEARDFIMPIRPGGVWGLAIGCIFAWSLYFSMRQRFPRVIRLKDEVQVLRAKNPLPQLIAARISIFALAITRSAAIVLGSYLGIGSWALLRLQVDYIQTIAELSLLASVFAVGILVAGILLERLCSPPTLNGVVDSKQPT